MGRVRELRVCERLGQAAWLGAEGHQGLAGAACYGTCGGGPDVVAASVQPL